MNVLGIVILRYGDGAVHLTNWGAFYVGLMVGLGAALVNYGRRGK